MSWIPAIFLTGETVAFGIASLVHSGWLATGHEHAKAATAEGVIALVLIAGLVAGMAWVARARHAALLAQAMALLGTLVGAFTIAIGVGPQSVPDYGFHAVIMTVLVAGIVVTVNLRDVEASR